MFRELARQRESETEEGHLMPDHVHMMISIPPKYSVSQVVGYVNPRVAPRNEVALATSTCRFERLTK